MRASSDRRERTRRPYATRQLGLERSHRCRRFRALVRRERLHGTRLVAREQHTALLDSSVFHVNSSLSGTVTRTSRAMQKYLSPMWR